MKAQDVATDVKVGAAGAAGGMAISLGGLLDVIQPLISAGCGTLSGILMLFLIRNAWLKGKGLKADEKEAKKRRAKNLPMLRKRD